MIGHARFIRQAIELAVQAASKGDAPFGALLVVDGQACLTARNLVTTASDPTKHAELVLISEAWRRFSAETLPKPRCTLVRNPV